MAKNYVNIAGVKMSIDDLLVDFFNRKSSHTAEGKAIDTMRDAILESMAGDHSLVTKRAIATLKDTTQKQYEIPADVKEKYFTGEKTIPRLSVTLK